MTDDEWQAHVTREAAKAIGEWLEGRGRLHQPIAALTLPELEAALVAQGADAGLGYLINLARGILDTPLLFVALTTLIVIAVLLLMQLATVCGR